MAEQQSHQSDPRVLSRRTLETDHRHLAALLRPGMAVLDAGCGTGAITAGIATAVGPHGRVVGVDRDAPLLEVARTRNPGMAFLEADVLDLPFDGEFDVVNAARTLQWVKDPRAAVACMARAAKPGGLVAALDYDHACNTWAPEPPREFREFYGTFLAWREGNGWDNRMASHLPDLFAEAGLEDVRVLDASETSGRGDEASQLWLHVMDTIGPRFIEAPTRLEEAKALYREWIENVLDRQTSSMATVIGRRRRVS